MIDRLGRGIAVPMEEMLPTRYALDGRFEGPGDIEDEPWPNYQLDGYGAWLHELAVHHRRSGTADFDAAVVDLVARYLYAAWRTDCYDCWEEFGDGQHASTLAAISAGLSGASELLGNAEYKVCSQEIHASLIRRFVRQQRFCKGAGDDRVDASLLCLTLPFNMVEPLDPLMCKTVAAVREQLRGSTGGLYRYQGDTYFGGGEWILLTCWLGWYDATVGSESEYRLSREWVISAATATLELPEQITSGSQDGTMVEPWIRRWGPVATPLLWSHAMYLIMSEAGQSWS